MQELSNLDSFKNFEISKKSMRTVSGARTVEFQNLSGENGGCAKIVDRNSDGGIRKIKIKDRYQGKC